ncbi:MAG: DUF692 domain-containing protein [Blastomonas sp.]
MPESSLPPAAGIGLKALHYRDVLGERGDLVFPAWVEVHPQNYFGMDGQPGGGPVHRWLGAIAEIYPMSFHSVGLSLGSADGLDEAELEQLALLCDRYGPAMVSDHLSWSGNAHDKYPDLLPVPYSAAMLEHFADQIGRVQDRLKRRILIENPSRFLAYAADEMDEIGFIHALCQQAGCGLLFDINNVEVSCVNLGLCAEDYVDAVDPAIVGEIHLAGHSTEDHPDGPLKVDDHGSAVGELCWQLYHRFIARAGPLPTLIEWDTDIPDYPVLVAEMGRADRIMVDAVDSRHA